MPIRQIVHDEATKLSQKESDKLSIVSVDGFVDQDGFVIVKPVKYTSARHTWVEKGDLCFHDWIDEGMEGAKHLRDKRNENTATGKKSSRLADCGISCEAVIVQLKFVRLERALIL